MPADNDNNDTGNTQTEQDESKRENEKFRSYPSVSNKRKKDSDTVSRLFGKAAKDDKLFYG